MGNYRLGIEINEGYGTCLAHHGIKGQQWGVQNGPPYPLDPKEHAKVVKKSNKQIKRSRKLAKKGIRDQFLNQEHVIPAGTKVYRTTSDPNEPAGGHKYVTYLDEDRNFYRGSIGTVRRFGKSEEEQSKIKSYEVEYELNEDLRIPSRDELIKTGSELMLNDKSFRDRVKELREDYVVRSQLELDINTPINKLSKEQQKIYKETIDSIKPSFDDFYNNISNVSLYYVYGQVAMSLALGDDVRTKLFDTLKNKGYNAIMDENNVAYLGSNNGNYAPMIIFDGNEQVMNRTSTTELSRDEEKAYAKKTLKNKYKKARKNKGQWSII